MWCCLRDPAFSRFDTIPACGTHTDRHTHTHTHAQTRDDGYYPRIACAAHVKTDFSTLHAVTYSRNVLKSPQTMQGGVVVTTDQ